MRASVLLAFALAGCVGTPALPAPADPARAGGMTWGVSDCAFVIVMIPADPALVEARLPAGFALAPSPLSALPAGPSSTIQVDAYRCASGAWDGREVLDLSYGSYYADVTPPDELREDGYDAYFVKWDVLVQDAAARAALREAGLPAHDGEAVVTIDAARVSASLGFVEGGGFSLTGVLEEPAGDDEPLPFVEYTPLADGGLARWHARLHGAAWGTGAGVVEIAPGSWVREVVGADRAPAHFIAGAWNLDEADVAYPVAWQAP